MEYQFVQFLSAYAVLMTEFESDGPFREHAIEKGRYAGTVFKKQRWSTHLVLSVSIVSSNGVLF